MNFSAEEIYYQFGQFDQFVVLNFHFRSDSSKMFGSTLMGTFKYTLAERQELEEVLKTEEIPRTSKRIKFEPSSEEDLSSEKKVILDKEGVLCEDIRSIQHFEWAKKGNRYSQTGKREIPKTHTIEVDTSNMNTHRFHYNFIRHRIKSGFNLIPEEVVDLRGMTEFYNPDEIPIFESIFKDILSKNEVELPVEYYYLTSKIMNKEANDTDRVKIQKYLRNRDTNRFKIIRKEMTKSSKTWKDVPKKYLDPLRNIVYESVMFNSQLLLAKKFPIWWDFERFVHIFCRHVKETKIGERYEAKTIFRYEFEDIKRIIKMVIEEVYDDIVEHFKSNNSSFRRNGARSIYFDGVYYRLEIEKSGRLIAFHPYNDDSSSLQN